jgi:hypothetical protein
VISAPDASVDGDARTDPVSSAPAGEEPGAAGEAPGGDGRTGDQEGAAPSEAGEADVKPVFVDLTGRRRTRVRLLGYLLVIVCAAALAAIAAGLSPVSTGVPTYVIRG